MAQTHAHRDTAIVAGDVGRQQAPQDDPRALAIIAATSLAISGVLAWLAVLLFSRPGSGTWIGVVAVISCAAFGLVVVRAAIALVATLLARRHENR
jgi:hypothetical protein